MKKGKIQKLKSFSKLSMALLVAAFIFVSCTDDSGSMPNMEANKAPVTLQFKATSAHAHTTNAYAATNADEMQQNEDTLFIQGSNGTLKITDVYFVVDEFELERIDDGDDDDPCEGLEGQAEEDCEDQHEVNEEFEMGMSFVQLPIGQDVLEINTTAIEEGVYDKLDFEIDNLDTDEDDSPEEIAEQEAVLQAIADAGYQNWPEDASMVIEGVFAPTQGEEVPFTAYAEAEVSIEMTLNPPLNISDGSPQTLTVSINPENWFTHTDGTVVDLSQYDENNLYQMEWEIDEDNGFESDVDDD